MTDRRPDPASQAMRIRAVGRPRLGWRIAVVACLLAIGSARPAAGSLTTRGSGLVEYHSAENGYAITVPAGWVEIPADLVKAQANKLTPGGMVTKATVETAFAPASQKPGFGFPGSAVLVLPYASLGLTGPVTDQRMVQIASTINAADVTRAFARSANAKSARLTGVVFGPPRFDFASDRVLYMTSVSSKHLGTVRGEVIAVFGRDAVVVVSVTSPQADWSRYARIGWAMVDSIHFDRGRTRQRTPPSPSPTHEHLVIAGIALGGVILGFALFALVWPTRPAAAATTA